MKRYYSSLLLLGIMTSCSGFFDTPDNNPSSFNCQTLDASEVSESSACLNGTVSTEDSFINNVNVGFYFSSQYEVEKDLRERGEKTSAGVINVNDSNVFSIIIEELSPNTTYYYISYASEGSRITFGDVKHFTTKMKSSAIIPEGAVDMGMVIQSRQGDYTLYWAECNLGAKYPEESGDYYAWGEITPKSEYSWSNYRWCNGSPYALTKYNFIPAYGIVDNKTELDLSDDAAHMALGEKWRMPTSFEVSLLLDKDNFIWERESLYYVEGYRVTSKKTNNSIFLPLTGSYSDALNNQYSKGYIWTSSLIFYDAHSDPFCAWALGYGYSKPALGNDGRETGFPIRPVTE